MRYVEEKQIAQLDEIEARIKEEIAHLIPIGGDSDAA